MWGGGKLGAGAEGFFPLLPAQGCSNPGCPAAAPAQGLGTGALPITEPHRLNAVSAPRASGLKFAVITPPRKAGAFNLGSPTSTHESLGAAHPWQRPRHGTAGQACSGCAAVPHSRVPAVTSSRSASPGDAAEGWERREGPWREG